MTVTRWLLLHSQRAIGYSMTTTMDLTKNLSTDLRTTEC
jgi:hypothetical protein